MITVREVRTVDLPVDQVFDYVADFSTTEDWDPGVERARALDPIGPGARFEVDAAFLGRTLPMSYRIVTYEPPHRLVLEGRGATSRARDVIVFRTSPAGTTVDWRLELRLRGVARWFETWMLGAVEQLGRAALDGLARRLRQLPSRSTDRPPRASDDLQGTDRVAV